jgi:hypothetical protein
LPKNTYPGACINDFRNNNNIIAKLTPKSGYVFHNLAYLFQDTKKGNPNFHPITIAPFFSEIL